MQKKLYRSDSNKMISGVCGGLAEYFGTDVTLIRLAWVILSLLCGFGTLGLIIYIVCICIIPVDSGYIDGDYNEK